MTATSNCIQQLQEESRRWLNDALERLRQDGARLDLNCISIEEITGIHTEYYVRRILVDRQLRDRRQLLASIPPVNLASCEIACDPLGLGFIQEPGPVYFDTPSGMAARAPHFLMFDFLKTYLQCEGSLSFNQDVFDVVLADFAEYLFDHGEILVEAKAFVVNLDLDSRSEQFENGVALRGATEEERWLALDIATEWGYQIRGQMPSALLASPKRLARGRVRWLITSFGRGWSQLRRLWFAQHCLLPTNPYWRGQSGLNAQIPIICLGQSGNSVCIRMLAPALQL